MPTPLPPNFKLFNDQQTKKLVVIVDIEGVDLISTVPVFETPKYGDAINYGEADLIYGGLIRKKDSRSILDLDQSSLMISQKLEQEQGRGALSQMSFSFVDLDGYMSQVISRGVVVPEILNRQVRVWVGYQEISFPEDYFIAFRARVASTKAPPSRVVMQLSDPNSIRRKACFIPGSTILVGDITDADTTINVIDNSQFHVPILGPDATYDPAIKVFIQIDDEWISYTAAGVGLNQFTGVTRGARGTTPAAHTSATQVLNAVEIQDHAIDMALKTMLSGWDGPWKSDVTILSLIDPLDTDLGLQPQAIILPPKIDAIRDYNLTPGDSITITGSAFGFNNKTVKVVRFADLLTEKNRIVYVDQDLTVEYPTAAVMSFRSQYDTYPTSCGVALTPPEVDIAAHLDIKDTFFSGPEYSYRFFLKAQESLKTFIEMELYLPISAYSLTSRGQLSIGVTKQPISSDELIFLDHTNILNPLEIAPERGLNTRKTFTEVDYSYDIDDADTFTAFFYNIDATAGNLLDTNIILPITSRGLRVDLGANDAFLETLSNNFLSRYKNAAVLMPMTLNFGTIVQLEAGYVVAVKDEGNLKILDYDTGVRNLGTKLFEIIDIKKDFGKGNGTVQLSTGVNGDVGNRYGVFSPSSVIVAGAPGMLKIKDWPYGAKYPGDEMRKWRNFVGQKIVLNDWDRTQIFYTSILGFSATDNYVMFVDQITDIDGNPVTPADYTILMIDIPDYPTSTDRLENSLYKGVFTFRSRQVAVASGASPTQFTVAAGKGIYIFPGGRIIVHLDDYSVTSGEVVVADVAGDVITLDPETPLLFTPDNTYLIDGIGFQDKQGYYRYY